MIRTGLSDDLRRIIHAKMGMIRALMVMIRSSKIFVVAPCRELHLATKYIWDDVFSAYSVEVRWYRVDINQDFLNKNKKNRIFFI